MASEKQNEKFNHNFDFINTELNFKSSKKFQDNKNLKKRRREEEIYGTFYGDIIDDPKVNESKSNFNRNINNSSWEYGFDANIYNNQEEEEYSNSFQTGPGNFLNFNFIKGQKEFLQEKESKNSEQSKNNFNSTKNSTITLSQPEKKYSDDEVEKEFLKDYTADKIEKSKNTKDEKKAEAKLKETFGKGYSMLKKIGYKIGSGLGKNEQGITVPIEIKKRKKNAGISNESEEQDKSEKNILNNLTNISKLKEKHMEKGRSELDEFERILDNWEDIKNTIMSSDVIDFEVDLKTNNYDVNKFILDNSKKENFIFSSKNIFVDESFIEDMNNNPEKLKEDLVRVMKKSKDKISDYLGKIKSISDSVVNFNYEIGNLQEELKQIEKNKIRKEKFLKDLDFIKNEFDNFLDDNSNSTLGKSIENYKTFATHLIHLYMNNKTEYLKFKGLTSYCLEVTEEFLSKNFSFHDYLKKSKIILPLFVEIKRLVDKTENEDDEDFIDEESKMIDAEFSNYTHIFPASSTRVNDPFHIKRNEKIFGFFLKKIVINDLISYIINEWNVKEYEFLHKVFEIYSEIIPNFMKYYLIESVLIPRILEEITEKWEPDFSFSLDSDKPKISNMIHLWIHPWLDSINLVKLEPITRAIQEKIENKIITCDISNTTLIDILQPWKKIWEESYFDELSNRFIIPKLNYMFSKMQINPKDQDLRQLKILFKWNQSGLLDMEKSMPILLNHFFPKWLQTLYDWLNKTPNTEKKFEEIQKWYVGWKSLFSGNYLKYKEIEQEFKNALVLITSN